MSLVKDFVNGAVTLRCYVHKQLKDLIDETKQLMDLKVRY